MSFVDDTSVETAMGEEHLESLEAILEKLLAANVRLKFSKFEFSVRSVELLGHLVN